MESRGFVLIADITGYTNYLTASELEHAQATLATLLEVVVEHTPPPLVIAQLEGDAVMSYALEDGVVSAQTFLEAVEEAYVSFRRAIDLMVLNNTCRCNACANVSSLDLKFFLHHGTFAIQNIAGVTQLMGSDINLIHRLLKNTVTERTGVRAYILLTARAAAALSLNGDEAGLTPLIEDVADFGEVEVFIEDMGPVYETTTDEWAPYDQADRLGTLSVDIPLPIESVWDYLNLSEFRNVMVGSDRFEVDGRRSGRVGPGSTYQCYHGDMVVSQLVLAWRPFEQVVLQQLMPLPGKQPTHTILDVELAPIEGGTRLSQSVTRPTGPLLQRSLARAMLRMKGNASRRRMETFRDRIVEDFAAHGPEEPGHTASDV